MRCAALAPQDYVAAITNWDDMAAALPTDPSQPSLAGFMRVGLSLTAMDVLVREAG